MSEPRRNPREALRILAAAAARVEALRDHCLRFRPEPGQSCKSMNPNGPAEHWCWQCKRGAVLDAALAAIREGARG